MLSQYKSKEIRAKWSETDLRNATRSVVNGASIRGAAKANISEKKLRTYVKSNNLIKRRIGQPPVLGLDAEKKIVARVVMYS